MLLYRCQGPRHWSYKSRSLQTTKTNLPGIDSWSVWRAPDEAFGFLNILGMNRQPQLKASVTFLASQHRLPQSQILTVSPLFSGNGSLLAEHIVRKPPSVFS